MRKTITATVVAGALLAGTLSATSEARDAHHYHPHKVSTVGVYLPGSDTDGSPLEVARASVTHVHACTGHGYNRTCRARLDGYHLPVYVAGVDFPGRG